MAITMQNRFLRLVFCIAIAVCQFHLMLNLNSKLPPKHGSGDDTRFWIPILNQLSTKAGEVGKEVERQPEGTQKEEDGKEIERQPIDTQKKEDGKEIERQPIDTKKKEDGKEIERQPAQSQEREQKDDDDDKKSTDEDEPEKHLPGQDGCNIPPKKLRRQVHLRNKRLGIQVTVNTTALGSKIKLPLQGPPYYIIQHGTPRSASTFQRQLLNGISDLKSDARSKVQHYNGGDLSNIEGMPSLFYNTPIQNVKKLSKAATGEGRSRTDLEYKGKDLLGPIKWGFVQKSHDSDWVEKTICEFHTKNEKQVAVFASVGGAPKGNLTDDEYLQSKLNFLGVTYDPGFVVHIQDVKSAEFHNCSICQIKDHYKEIFGLTDAQVKILEEFMGYYQVIRQCCGVQMSKYNRLRVLGCNMTNFQQDESYPWCEKHDLEDVEKRFADLQSLHGFRPPPAQSSGWTKPGDCAAGDEIIRHKKRSTPSLRKWNGVCDLKSVAWIGAEPSGKKAKEQKLNKDDAQNSMVIENVVTEPRGRKTKKGKGETNESSRTKQRR